MNEQLREAFIKRLTHYGLEASEENIRKMALQFATNDFLYGNLSKEIVKSAERLALRCFFGSAAVMAILTLWCACEAKSNKKR